MKRYLPIAHVSAFAAAMLSIANVAKAAPDAPGGDSKHESAITNFEAGRRMLEQGNCSGAIPRFRESIQSEPSVGARFNLARCLKLNGRGAEAWNHYRAAEVLARTKGDDERATAAHAEYVALERDVVRVRLQIAETSKPIRVWVDETEVLAEDLPMLKVGYGIGRDASHVVRVESETYKPWTTTIRGEAALERSPIVVTLRPGPGPLSSPNEPTSSALRTSSFVVAGVGLAGLALGTVFGAITVSQNSAYQDAINDPANGCGTAKQTCNGVVRELRDATVTSSTLSTVGFVAGGVLTAAGLSLFLLSPSAPQKRSTRGQLSVTVSPMSMAFSGQF